METGTEYGLVDLEETEVPGDEWEEIDVSDTEADRIARKRDRKFEQFEERIKDADQFKVEQSVFDDATLAALYKLVQDGYVEAFGGPLDGQGGKRLPRTGRWPRSRREGLPDQRVELPPDA